MGTGESVRNAVTSAIVNLGSDIVITPYTISSSDSGYSGQVETDGTPVTEIAIPYALFKSILKQQFGDLESGKFQLALKYTATIELSGTTKYKVTYQNEIYDVINEEKFPIANVNVATIITLSKRLE